MPILKFDGLLFLSGKYKTPGLPALGNSDTSGKGTGENHYITAQLPYILPTKAGG